MNISQLFDEFMDKKLLQLNQDLLLLIEGYADNGIPIGEWTQPKSFLIFAFAKSYRTVNSVLLLCENGYGQDAFMLVRTLFELLITTAYIFKEDTDNRITQYNEYDWVLRNKMLSSVKKNKDSKGKSLLQERSLSEGINLKEIKQKSKEVLQSYEEEDAQTWSKKSIFQMAKAVGLEDLYDSLYALGSQLTHSASRSANEYMRVVDGELELLTYPSDNYIDESLVGSFMCFYHIVKQLDEVFDLALTDSLAEFEKRITELT